MAVEKERLDRWYFSKAELADYPSRVDGVDPAKELGYRQSAASMVQDMGEKLQVYVARTAPS